MLTRFDGHMGNRQELTISQNTLKHPQLYEAVTHVAVTHVLQHGASAPSYLMAALTHPAEIPKYSKTTWQ